MTQTEKRQHFISGVQQFILDLRPYDPGYYEAYPADFYRRINWDALIEFHAMLKKRHEFMRNVRGKANIITRQAARQMRLEKIIKDGYVCQYTGICWVKERTVRDEDFKVYYTII